MYTVAYNNDKVLMNRKHFIIGGLNIKSDKIANDIFCFHTFNNNLQYLETLEIASVFIMIQQKSYNQCFFIITEASRGLLTVFKLLDVYFEIKTKKSLFS